MAFFCGASSFEDDPWAPSTPTGASKRRQGGGSSNPYSTRGLEKFTMLLADLETRRETIMAAAGSQGVALVQFVYSNSGDWVPIVVRPREQPPQAASGKPKTAATGQAQKRQEHPALPPPPPQQQPVAEPVEAARDRAVRKIPSLKVTDGEGSGGARWWRPSHYLPLAVALVLLCLAASGRAFAICCAAMWWYSLPIAAARGGEGSDVRASARKEHRRRVNGKRPAAAAGGGDVAAPAQGRRTGLEGLASPRRHHHHASMKKG